MIVEWLVQVGAGFAQWIVSLFPSLVLPSDLVHLDTSIKSLLALGAGTGVFVDWSYIGLVAGIPLAVWGAGVLVKAIRTLIAHIPFIGGRG